MDAPTANRYLARIGVARPPAPNLEALRQLQTAHLQHVPFENLDIHLGVPITLSEPALVDKIIHRNRGGFCYEVNGLFAALLRALNYNVTLLQAQVRGEGPSIPFDHLTLRVDLDEPWLVDVGFGQFAHHPLRIDAPHDDQVDPDGVYRIADAPYGDFDVTREGEPQLRVDRRPRKLAEFVPTCWWHQTSPESKFTKRDVCSLLTDDGRVTLRGRTLIRTHPNRSEHVYANETEVLAAYEEIFHVRIPRAPGPA